MPVRSFDRNLSFKILRGISSDEEDDVPLPRANSDPISLQYHDSDRCNIRKKKKKHKKKRSIAIMEDGYVPGITVPESGGAVQSRINGHAANGDVLVEHRLSYGGGGTLVSVVEEEEEVESVLQTFTGFGELRQRNIGGGGEGNNRVEESGEDVAASVDQPIAQPPQQPSQQQKPPKGGLTRFDTAESFDWKRLFAEDPNYAFTMEKTSVKYILEDGSSLGSTVSLGNEEEREVVYDTIFRLPWRCEALIDVGFFVCFDSFLSLLTMTPTRVIVTLWKFVSTRQFKRPSAAELCDFGCFLVFVCGVALLDHTDISLIYHMIRGQGAIKLYVVYNLLEIFDKLCQNFGGDVLGTLFYSANGLANSSEESKTFWIQRILCDQALAIAFSILHSFVLLVQAITLSTCIIAHNNALLALLVSNNFAEIKSNVFKRFSKDNIRSVAYSDSIERFHISAFLLFVLGQNIREAEGPWFKSFLSNALVVIFCEVLIDIIKHSFLAKFNGIKPIAYSEFLEDLCMQTLNIQNEDRKHNLIFVPVAPACVVIRVLIPLLADHLPANPLPWRLFCIMAFTAVTYVMLTILKVSTRMLLQQHATWYVNRCRKRRHHLHVD